MRHFSASSAYCRLERFGTACSYGKLHASPFASPAGWLSQIRLTAPPTARLFLNREQAAAGGFLSQMLVQGLASYLRLAESWFRRAGKPTPVSDKR